MKNNLVSVFFAIFLFAFSANGQTTVQGTIVDLASTGFPNSARLAGKPNISINDVLFGNINITVSIPDLGGANPTEAQIGKTIEIPSLDLVAPVGNPYVFGGRAYYSYILIANANPATTTWLANTNNTIMDLSFPAVAASYGLRLDDVSPAGGPNGQMYWYVQITGQGDITNYAQMFYGAAGLPPVNTGGAAASYVPLQSYSLLPVKFLNFTVTENNNNAVLNWMVGNEGTETDGYEIERSTNGTDFSSIARVDKKSNNLSSNAYEFTDANIIHLAANSSGRIYYRIKQIDKTGKFILSEVRNIKIGVDKSFTATIYPNPVITSTNLDVTLVTAGDINISIMNAAGKMLQQINWRGRAGNNYKNINMSNFAAGTYYIKIQAGHDVKVLPAIKIN